MQRPTLQWFVTLLPCALVWTLTTQPGCSRGAAAAGRIPRVEAAVAEVSSSGAGVVYLRVVNDSETAEVLESVNVLGAADAQLQEVVSTEKLSTTRHAPNGFPIPPRATVSLREGGKCILVFGLRDPQHVARLELRLRFKRAGVVGVVAPVRAASIPALSEGRGQAIPRR